MTFGSPNFGNSFTLDTGAQVKRTLDGSLLVDPWRRPTESFTVDFSAKTEAERDAFLAFVIATAGIQITLTDHTGVDWFGFIIDEIPTTSQSGIDCQFNYSFTFEGIKV